MADPRHVKLLEAGVSYIVNLLSSYFNPPQSPKAKKPSAEIINFEGRKAQLLGRKRK